MKYKLYQEIASLCGAYHRCVEKGNDFAEKHLTRLHEIEKNELPRGSGIDSGTKIDIDESGDEKIVLLFCFHHMNENGFYDGWTGHKAIITPSFSGFSLRITGRDRNGIKDYLHETFSYVLDGPYDAPKNS